MRLTRCAGLVKKQLEDCWALAKRFGLVAHLRLPPQKSGAESSGAKTSAKMDSLNLNIMVAATPTKWRKASF